MHQHFIPANLSGFANDAIDLSDYINGVAPFIQHAVGEVGDLLDIGAGNGQLGLALYTQCRHWVAIEPDPFMCNLLSSGLRCSQIIAGSWHEVHHLIGRSFDTVLAAHLPIPLTDANHFLQRCRHWTRDTIVWLVSAETTLLDQLPAADQPDIVHTIDWSLTCRMTDLKDFTRQQAHQLGVNESENLLDWVQHHARQQDDGWQLVLPQRSTVLIWKDQ